MLRARHLPSICARTASLLACCPQLTQSTPNQTQPWRWPCLALCQQFHALAASSGAQVLALTLQASLVPGAADILQAAVAGGAGLSLGEKVLCQELCVWSHRAEGYFPIADFAPALCKALLASQLSFSGGSFAVLRVYQCWASPRTPPAQTQEPSVLQPLGRHCSGMQGKLLFIPILPNLFH